MTDAERQRDAAELLTCRLAYEAGVHWLDANVRALEALRTRLLALVSVVLIAAAIVADLAPDAAKRDALGSLGVAGIVLLAVGAAVVLGAAAHVAWPARLTAELGPKKIMGEHAAQPSLTWPPSKVYRSLAENLDNYAKKSRKVLRRRARSYSGSLVALLMALVGFALLWADVNF